MFEFGETGIALTASEIGYAQLVVVAALLAALAVTGWMAVAASAETRLATGLRAARAALRFESLPMPLFVLALLLWAAVTLVLVAGLFALIGSVLVSETPPSGEEGRPILWEFRFKLAQLAVLTTVLGAVVALPITLNRLKLAREANETAKDTLFNTQITEAAADLHAQRQVTRRYADGRLRDEYEDDVIRRNTAIDRLEGLVKERPAEAERVARLLSVYVREMSREYPPVKTPGTEDVDVIREWARRLRPARSDMENAVKVLRRLTATAGLTENILPIDLRGANLQRFDMEELDLRNANLSEAQMQGADLTGAQMQGAHLGRARLQGADLTRARLREAGLTGARLREARLIGAEMQGARLIGAQMQGADLGWAQMQGADLTRAQMQGARLIGAEMQGADLTRAQMDDATDLSDVSLRGASLRSVDDTTIARLKPFWGDIFADGTVQVPKGERPAHWATTKLATSLEIRDGKVVTVSQFIDAWRAWQRSIGQDPSNPE